MDENYKLKIDFLISSDSPLSHPTQTTLEPIFKKCNGCKRRRKVFNKTDQICYQCYKAKNIPSSGNEVIDDFIKYTLTNYCKKEGEMEFVPYDRFKHVEFIAEGGFSRIYKATWIDGPMINWNEENLKHDSYGEVTIVLKELNNSESINSKELNELKIYYNFVSKWKPDKNSSGFHYKKDPKYKNTYYHYISTYNNINQYYGITRDPITKNFMIITKYYESGDLAHYLANNFFNYKWYNKLNFLLNMASGLKNIHDANIIHKDYHSGNIFVTPSSATLGDLGLSKSAIESLDDDNEVYGIIPYVAPEIFQGQKYTKASDIYSFGMIMWELMTGRRPFWDKNHDSELIIDICDGVRPPIVTNAPEGYIELMKECWHSDPNKRPTANGVLKNFERGGKLFHPKEYYYQTNIIKSPDIGPITNNPNAIYKSRPLSAMIKSAESTRSLKIQRSSCYQNNYKPFDENKRKRDCSLIKDTGNNINDNDKTIKKIKLNKDDDYLTKELGFDIDNNTNLKKSNNTSYTTREIDFDI